VLVRVTLSTEEMSLTLIQRTKLKELAFATVVQHITTFSTLNSVYNLVLWDELFIAKGNSTSLRFNTIEKNVLLHYFCVW